MTPQDFLAIACAIVAVAAVAYAIVTHKRAKELEAHSAPTKPAPNAAAPAPKPAAAERAADDAVERTTVKVKEQQGEAPEVEIVSETDDPFALVEKAHFEEDEDVEATKVGQSARRPTDPPKMSAAPTVASIVYDEDAATDEPTQSEVMFLVSATAQTDKGLRRSRNEDSLLVDDAHDLFVVADGMGGYRGGLLASQLAVRAISDVYTQVPVEIANPSGLPRDAMQLARAIQAANDLILETATKESAEGMGTTVCAMRFSLKKRRLHIGHVGDSRCYRLRDGVLSQLTADHTMRDFGVTGPESQQLSRAVGIWQSVPIDLVRAVPAIGDVYLLCSDGLTKMLKDDTIATVLRNEEDPKAAVERLVSFANAHGGKDNITVILVRVVEPKALSNRPAS